MRTSKITALAAALVLTAAACSSEPIVDKKDVASEISSQLGSSVGHEPESVTCPNDLQGKVGATDKCSLTDAGQNYGVTVTVTSVDGTNVKFDIKVDDKPS